MAVTKKRSKEVETDAREAVKAADQIASSEQNARLEHTEGGATTRMDATDLGVPMLPGSPDEPRGPEDALGAGKKRGDYRGRIGGENYQPHETVKVKRAKQGEAQVKVVAQRPRAEDIGDEAGVKGGVETQES